MLFIQRKKQAQKFADIRNYAITTAGVEHDKTLSRKIIGNRKNSAG